MVQKLSLLLTLVVILMKRFYLPLPRLTALLFLTQDQALGQILPLYNTRRAGVAFWGGHGNDPYMFSTDTMMRVADAAKGKTSVFIYPEYDRLRQHSHQMIPNHFLRAMTYNVACGATYLNNFPVDQQYFSILYELIAKGGESAT